MELIKNDKVMLTEEELTSIRMMNEQFSKAKMALGEVELEKHSILKRIDEMQAHFSANEKLLIEKYGANSVINIQTGEVTEQKEK
jgi:hypothetical protein